MSRFFVGLLCVVATLTIARGALAQADAKDTTPEPARVGNIYVIGNDRTREDVIRPQLRFYPGQILSYAELRVSEKNLKRLGIFENNPDTGVKPTIEVLPQNDPNCPFHDILVHIQETKTWSVKLIPKLNPDGKLVMEVVWEERNFDPLNRPTSIDDLKSGNAFRGGGKLVRVKLREFELFQNPLP
jgi:outer membrane protein insertion porin family